MKNDQIMNLDDIKDKLKDKRLYIVSERTGISYPILNKLSKGEDSNYTIDTLKKVSTYLLNPQN